MSTQLIRLTLMQAALVRRAIDQAVHTERQRMEAHRRAGDHNEAHWSQVRISDLLDLDRELVTAMNPMDRRWKAVFAGIPRPEVETLYNNQVEDEGL